MICPSCGAQCGNGGFCTNCGAKLPEDMQAVNPAPQNNYSETNATPAYNNAAPAYNAAPAQPKKNGASTAALVLGIIGLAGNTILNCLRGCIGSLPTFICAIVGLVLGIKANKEAAARGETDSKAKTGMILCIVALAVGVIVSIVNMVIGAAAYSEYY